MEIDFNDLRIQTAKNYNRLVNKLNRNIFENYPAVVEVDVDEIEDILQDLRTSIVTLCCCYLENNESVKSVVDKINHFEIFNDEN